MAVEFIFVYGTLRKQIALDICEVLVEYCEYFSDGVMQGTLYEVAGYPGAIESNEADDKVFGEIYTMLDRKRVLDQLDEYEECSKKFPMPHEYSRKQVSITLIGGDSVIAWVYLYKYDVSKLQQIISGDYLAK